MIEATLLEKADFDYTLKVQAEVAAREAAVTQAKKAAQLAYKEELQVPASPALALAPTEPGPGLCQNPDSVPGPGLCAIL